MPPNPPTNAHGFAMRSMPLRDMQIPKSEKKILGPPLPNPGDAPVYIYIYIYLYQLFNNYMNIDEHMGGGKRRCLPPPPRPKIKINRDMVGRFTSFSPVGGTFSLCGRIFAIFYSPRLL